MDEDRYSFIYTEGGTLSANYPVGSRVRKLLGSAVTMTQWPTVTPSLGAWTSTDPNEVRGGFEGTLDEDVVGLKVGMTVRVEVTLDGITDQQAIWSWLEPVVEVGRG